MDEITIEKKVEEISHCDRFSYCDGRACDNPDLVDDGNIICTGACEGYQSERG